MDRRAIAISGIVQGVGFRPFVHGLASRLELRGFVKNFTGGVLIEVEGEPRLLDRFLDELSDRPPPMARIDDLQWSSRAPRGDRSFRIEASGLDAEGPIFVSPDVATCADCLAELFDPNDRRYRYPFLNCTNCGPRFTIIEEAPYDRERTSMARFEMCADCRAEYECPTDRRFHAQPNACPVCGPRLALLNGRGEPVAADDPLSEAVAFLRHGGVGAIKGLGGYHLACDAENARAVDELRRRKQRDEKPFAIMVRDLEAARALCDVSAEEAALLDAPRRPIVLLRRRDEGPPLADGVATRGPWLGVMLPYTPLHHLLLREVGAGPLVMTSGNRSDEPIAHEDHDARRRLAGIADFFLAHDRPIHRRCDDSVTRIVAGSESPIRRARGEAPQPIAMPIACRRPILALGGQRKTTFALGRGRHAFLSHHIGDLDQLSALRAYEEAIEHFQQLFDVRPELLAHDLHADYQSSRYAREHAHTHAALAIQHHHAHMASCMAENGLEGPVIGTTFDGSGLGTDNVIWGGEFLTGDYRDFHRAAHFRPVAMPGGEQAVREPWRMAAAYLIDAGEDLAMLSGPIEPSALKQIERMLERGANAPLTTSAGRLFDAVAALIGTRHRVSYEGQAAIELEWLALGPHAEGAYSFDIVEGDDDGHAAALAIDARPMIVEIVAEVRRGAAANAIARRFHSTVVEMIVQTCDRVRARSGLNRVVLSGGVFLNATLSAETMARLAARDFQAFRHHRVPPNDGGLSLGQLAIAAASFE